MTLFSPGLILVYTKIFKTFFISESAKSGYTNHASKSFIYFPMQEMQLLQTWHAIVGVVLRGLIFAHIYIGAFGMEGAIDAMWTGEGDENWAREHHAAWVAELKGEAEPEPLKFAIGNCVPFSASLAFVVT